MFLVARPKKYHTNFILSCLRRAEFWETSFEFFSSWVYWKVPKNPELKAILIGLFKGKELLLLKKIQLHMPVTPWLELQFYVLTARKQQNKIKPSSFGNSILGCRKQLENPILPIASLTSQYVRNFYVPSYQSYNNFLPLI